MLNSFREINFQHKKLKIVYRDDSDQSVIDEFFVDRLYRSLENIIPHLTGTILDIGAHIGVFSLYASILNPSLNIFALEPEPQNFELLRQNLKLNHVKNIISKQLALHCNNEPSTPLFLSTNTHNHSTTNQTEDQIIVPAIELEKLLIRNKIEKVDLLKMDIEGGEFNILPTWSDEMWAKINYIILEYHEDKKHKRGELENLIRSHGFSLEHFSSHLDRRFGLFIGRNKKTG